MGFKTFLSIFILVISSFSLSAQNLPDRAERRARNRAENRANSTVDRQVDRTVDGAIDAVGGLFRRRNRNRNQEAETTADTEVENTSVQLPGILTGGPWEPYTNPTPFSLTMEITDTNRRGREETTTMMMSVDTEAFGIRVTENGEETRMILDTQTGKVVAVTNDGGETSAIRMRMPNIQTPEEAEEAMQESMEGITIERTGETRIIDGYTCEKTVVTTDDGTVTEAWITEDIELTAMDMASPFAKMFQSGGNLGGSSGSHPFSGFMIEATNTDRRGNVNHIKVRDVKLRADADHSILDVSGLQIQDVGF
ncbi:MAG: DUF4412 domain-containing protein [Bacteroidota bacterium]